jgi:hypothetical protein
MTVQARQARGWTGGRRRVLAALLALAILIPLGVLFLDHTRNLSESRSKATQERHGIEYLLALNKLTIALTDAQSAVIGGSPVAGELLDGALANVQEVDERFGEELRVRERWIQLRDTIERVTSTDHANGRAAYTAYGEATGLLLGLHDRLRETAGLVRDPDEDANHLQEAAAGMLPETLVAAGRLVDLVVLRAGESAGAPPADPTELSIATAAVTRPGDDLVAGIQAALDSTESRSLSSSVLAKYDRFLRAKDGLLLTVPPDGNLEAVDFGQLAFIRGEVQDAGDDLATALLTELDTLIRTRLSELTRSLWTAVVAVSVGVLLAFALLAVALIRDSRQPTRHRHRAELPAGSGDDQLGGGGSDRETPQFLRPLTPMPDLTPPSRNRLAGELLRPEGADVR